MAASDTRYKLHRLLTEMPDLLESLRREAVGFPTPHENGLVMAFENGRRSLAVEWYSLYEEVEDERRRKRA